jgi:hypothetical protein
LKFECESGSCHDGAPIKDNLEAMCAACRGAYRQHCC